MVFHAGKGTETLHAELPPSLATQRARPRQLVSFAALLALLGSLGSALVVAQPAGAATTLFVSATGSDANPCTAAAPCATVSQALFLAGSGSTIEVAGHIFDSVFVGTTVTIEQWPGQAAAVVDASQLPGQSVFFNVSGNLTLDGLTITGGSALDGAGINTFGFTTTTVTHSTITGNTTTNPAVGLPGSVTFGGGITNAGTFTLTDSTVTANTAAGDPTGPGAGLGGGVEETGSETMTITDSTITGNTAGAGASGGGIGGGIYVQQGTLTITGSTISGNTAAASPISGGQGGGIFADGATTIGGTILAANTADTPLTQNCVFGVGGLGSITSVGYNLSDDATGAACGFTQPTDKVNVNPTLGPLAANGGPTETLLPASASPDDGVIPSPTTLNGVPVCGPGAFDQRGVPRPSGGSKCTIGAVEVPSSAPTITSANNTTFSAGTHGGFTVTTSGVPPPALSASTGPGQSGLPQGVNLTDNGNGTGTLTGIATTPGTYTFIITASNGVLPPANQNFTLTVTMPSVPAPTLSGGARLAVLPNGTGYWIVHPDGGVFGYADTAPFFGSIPGLGLHLNNIAGMAATPDGGGYWLVGADGGVFTFGDAKFYGSLPGLGVHVGDIVSIAASPDGGGYWLVGSDGGVFSFGDATFSGSMGGKPLNQPMVAMSADPSGGYWLVASDGGIFSFGGAPFMGSMGGTPLVEPVVGVTAAPGGIGYWLVASDGGVFAFGQARFVGSLGGNGGSPVRDIIGLFSRNGGNDYTLVEASGTAHPF